MRIRFPIGDWSRDGHSQCEYYVMESNKSVSSVREIHFNAIERLGFDIGKICCDNEDTEISDSILKKLRSAKFCINKNDKRYFDNGDYCMNFMGVLHLWIDILKFIDPTLKLEEVEDNASDINFYGFDKEGRHLNTPGYGVFL